MLTDAQDRSAVLAWIRASGHAVVATVGADGTPAAALVGIAALDDGTLVFGTKTNTRKTANLAADPRIAVVVASGLMEVQLRGTVVIDGPDRLAQAAAYLQQRPGAPMDPDTNAVIAIHPTWIRVCDLGANPPVRSEADWS